MAQQSEESKQTESTQEQHPPPNGMQKEWFSYVIEEDIIRQEKEMYSPASGTKKLNIWVGQLVDYNDVKHPKIKFAISSNVLKNVYSQIIDHLTGLIYMRIDEKFKFGDTVRERKELSESRQKYVKYLIEFAYKTNRRDNIQFELYRTRCLFVASENDKESGDANDWPISREFNYQCNRK